MIPPDPVPSRTRLHRRAWLLPVVLVALGATGGSLAYALTATTEPVRLVVSTPTPAPQLTLVSGPAATGTGTIAWSAPLALTVTDGVVTHVVATDAEGTTLDGAIEQNHRRDGTAERGTGWHSYASSLLPGMGYRLAVTVEDASGQSTVRTLTATATRAARYLHAVISPSDHAVVGVGLPVIVTLNQPVTDLVARAEVQARLTVATSPMVEGAWRWMSPNELHYRSANYWASGTQIVATANFRRLQLPDGTWGEGNHSSTWTIGRSFISTVDNTTNLMTSTVDGKVVRVMKDSLGRAGYETASGVHLVLEKQASLVMDSTTTGHAVGDKDYYKETVLWTVRISYGGAFVHSAPWSVLDQGVRNVSHGCVNLSPVDAEWFYGQALRGDVVDIVNTGVAPNRHDPGMSDWNYTFAEWQQT